MTMHAALNRGSTAGAGEAFFFAEMPDVVAETTAPTIAGGGYGQRSGPDWLAIAIIVGLHVVALVALVKLDIISVQKPKIVNLKVFDIAEAAPPPMEEPKPEKIVEKVEPVVVTPVPIVQTFAPPPPPVQVTNTPPPPKPTVVAVSPAPPAPSGPVVVSDLSDPVFRPAWGGAPMDVRRKGKGLRTVTVRLTIGLTGQVEISELAQSSGFGSLDQAVVKWVKKWRFGPVIRNGEAVQARAIVPISINIT